MGTESVLNTRRTAGILLFAGAFLATWSVWAILLVHHPLPQRDWPVRLIARLVLFLLPTLLYVRFALREQPVHYLRLAVHPGRGLLFGLIAGLLPLGELVWRSLRANALPQLPGSADLWLNTILAAPLTEEILFRGLIFRELSRASGAIAAAVYSSLLFAALHFPYWYFSAAKTGSELVRSLVLIFAIGLLCCGLACKSRTLVAPLVFHFLNNLASSCTF
jgi:CAAX protease family protein